MHRTSGDALNNWRICVIYQRLFPEEGCGDNLSGPGVRAVSTHSRASTRASIAVDTMTRVHVFWLVLVLLKWLCDYCVGFDVCNNLIQVENDLDGNKQVVACRYQILKWDRAGVFLRETVRTPVNSTLCHDLRTADTCHPDGSLVTCHHVPEWERHPPGTFLPPEGCTFSQNVQCQLETICPTESKITNIETVSNGSDLTSTAKVRSSEAGVVPITTAATPVGSRGSTTEHEEITQHIVIHVRKSSPENRHSAGTAHIAPFSTFALSFLFSMIFMNMVL